MVTIEIQMKVWRAVMANIKKSMTELIGHTPLLELTNIEKKYDLKAELIAKLEYFNPNQSAKDRIALQIIEDAEEEGKLKKGDTIVETTSGNTGIALAGVAAAKGYRFDAYLQRQASQERYQTVRALGGNAINNSTVPVVKKALEENDDDFVAGMVALKQSLRDNDTVFFADQCFNESNPKAHEKTTGPEIWEDTDGKLDIVVVAVGTGGTITGIGRYLKKKNPHIRIVGVQPSKSTIPSKDNPNPVLIQGIHRVTEIPEERRSLTLDVAIIDEIYSIEPEEAFETAREVAKEEGILLGQSSGAAILVARQLAQKEENAGKRIIALAADTGLRYLSLSLFE